MPTFTWTIPEPSPATSTTTSSSSVTTPPDALFGNFDQEIDPATRDYVDTPDGAWSETASSRSKVMCQLSIRWNSWPPDPEAGTRVPELLESGEPITPEEVIDDTRRALQLLVEDGDIADLSVEVGTFDPEAGALLVEISYTDLSSGHTVELAYSPL